MGWSGRRQQIRRWAATAAALTLVACAGRSTREEPAGSGGTSTGVGGTSTGVGGTSTGVGGTSTGTGGTSTGASGGSTSSGGTGNARAGSGGSSGTATTCTYAGVLYVVGETYAAGDGCNTCTCTPSGSACTAGACAPDDDCNAIAQAYSADTATALACKSDGDCSFVARAIACGCQFYASDTSALDALADAWSAEQCAEKYPLKCPACFPLGYPYCDQSGQCASDVGGTGGAAGTSGTGGVAGTSGSADEAGAAGCGDPSGCASPRCDMLSQAYTDAFTQAQKCVPGGDTCSEQALSPSSCACPAYVTDTSALDRIEAEQATQHCPRVAPCPCPLLPSPSSCGTDGLCGPEYPTP